MKIYKYNGEEWYHDKRSLWKRIRQWFVWIGGWELANGEGWKFRLDSGKLAMPHPISFLGHFITLICGIPGYRLYQIKLRSGYWVYSSDSGIYFSSNGTPDRATITINPRNQLRRDVESAVEHANKERARRAAIVPEWLTD